MKSFFAVALFLCAVFPLSAGEDQFLTALTLIAQSKVEGCSICADKDGKKAVKIIDQAFIPGKTISVAGTSQFIRTAECVNNEFVLSSRPVREKKTLADGSEIELPLVTYRIHTDGDHLAGINRADFTGAEEAKPFAKFRYSKSWKGEGELVLVPYAYGDGKCFIYFPKHNTLQFQCKVVKVKTVK